MISIPPQQPPVISKPLTVKKIQPTILKNFDGDKDKDMK
jgi:hypothetical protein